MNFHVKPFLYSPKNLFSIAIISTIAVTSTSCGSGVQSRTPTGDGVREKLVLTGSSTVAPLVAEIAKRFERRYPNIRVDVQTGGSSRGIADARSQVADIGMVSRDLKPEERDLQAFPIARDGIGIIVHKDNPVRSLSDRQIVDIYTGKINNWQQVGGRNAPIVVVNKAEGRSTLELFIGYFKMKNSEIKPSTIIGDNQQGIKTVAGNQNAIGYVSIGAAEFSIADRVPIALLPLGGVPANTANINNGTFPLSRNLNLVDLPAKQRKPELVRTFIEFARSPQVNDIIKSQDFVPIAK